MNDPFSASIDQLGIVVPDLEAAIGEWLELGIGPFLIVRGAAVAEYEYRGKSSKPVLDVAFAQKGEVQLELIQQANDAPSVYRDFIAAGGNGFHHFGWFCESYQSALAAADNVVLQKGAWSGIHFVYYETTRAVGAPAQLGALGEATRAAVTAARAAGATKIVELIELNDTSRAVFRLVREAAARWDGKTNPVRTLFSPGGALHVAADVLSYKLERWLHSRSSRQPRPESKDTMGTSTTAQFRKVGKSAALPDNYVNPYYLEDLKRRIAVARLGGKLYAFDDLAPNSGCPLSAGLLTGTTIMSQCDGSQFDITTGAVQRGPATSPLATYEVREASGEIEVRT